MKKMSKKDFLYICIIVLSFLLLVIFSVKDVYLYGSTNNWLSEYIAFPEYFRTLFYETKDLFPDFAFNIGNGQNIYNFSYYGLLSPIYFISYLFPNVSMSNYVITITVLLAQISVILLYIFLKNKNNSSENCLLSTFIFICATCITFNTHHNILFIHSLTFTILGLYGVDKKLKENKGWLLSICIILIILTNWYSSISSIVTLTIYSLYNFLKDNKFITFQKTIKHLFNIFIPIVIGVLISSILTLPTLHVLSNNKNASLITYSIWELLTPEITMNNILFNPQGLGLTTIIIPAIINILKKEKENRFLFILLTIIIILPIFTYMLNFGMSLSNLVLIPLLPLFIFVISEFIEDVINNNLNLKSIIILSFISLIIVSYNYLTKNSDYIVFLLLDLCILFACIFLYKKFQKKMLFILPILIITFITSLNYNLNDSLILKEIYQNSYQEIQDIIKIITLQDKDFYRISNQEKITETVNETYENIKYYNSSVSSVTSNLEYNYFYYNIMNNNISHYSSNITSQTTNIMSLMFSGNKYIISQDIPLQGYNKIGDKNGINIYRNDSTLPLGFGTSNIMSYEDFNQLSNPAKQEALLNVIVTDEVSNNDFASALKEIDINLDTTLSKNYIIKKNNTYILKLTEDKKIEYDLPEEYQNKIIFISFDMKERQDCNLGNQIIKINNTQNILTCKDSEYYNHNEKFYFVLSEQDLKKLTINISKGNYKIANVKVYTLDYASLENIQSRFDVLKIDSINKDTINGSVNISNDGYFMFTIPYDQGFTITVDNQKVKYEKVDEAFIGIKISKGKHKIKLAYESPLKKEALLISCIGLIFLALVTYFESKRKI